MSFSVFLSQLTLHCWGEVCVSSLMQKCCEDRPKVPAEVVEGSAVDCCRVYGA